MLRGCGEVAISFEVPEEVHGQETPTEESSVGSSQMFEIPENIYNTWAMPVQSKLSTSAYPSVEQLSNQGTDGSKSDGGSSIVERKRRPAVYDLLIQNLTYKVSKGKEDKANQSKVVLLNNVSAKANNSEILAIIGRSGSSKTTLLDALAGRIDARSLEGSILVNGKRVDDGLKSISGYVMQEDALFPMLTVTETLLFSAKLRLPRTVSKRRKLERVQALIKEFGLSSCCDTRVGSEKIRGISGGERRRLSIGVDVIHDPPVLLLDEPTSGLDSTSALNVMETLCRLAVRRRRTVVLTVHQPSYRIMGTIHNILVLAMGTVAYHGTSEGMDSHFSHVQGCPMPDHVSVVEYALDTIAGLESTPGGLSALFDLERERRNVALGVEGDEYKSKPQANTGLTCPQSNRRSARRRRPSILSEMMVLSQRNFMNIFRTHTLFLTRVGVTVLTSLILVTLFYRSKESEKGIRNRQTFFIFTVAILVFTSTEALPIFLHERQIFIRETSRGAYRTSSYVLSHSVVVIPFLLFLAVLCTLLCYFAVGLAVETGAVFFFSFIIFLVLCMANAFVTMVSALAPNFTVALAVVGGVSAYMFLFSGFFMNRRNIPPYWLWLHYLSLFKYSYESLLANEFENRPGVIWYDNLDSSEVLTSLVGGKVNQLVNILIMVGFVVGYRIVFYLALRFGTSSVRK